VTVTDEHAPGSVRINLLFNERPVRVPYGVTLFDAASWNGIAIDSTCGGHGTCKKCRVRIAENAPPPTSLDIRAYTAAEIGDGWRLACRTAATGDTRVEVPPLTTRPKAATVGVGRQVILRPAVQKRYLELAEPDLADQASDLERVLARLDDLEPRAELPVLKALGRTLRAAELGLKVIGDAEPQGLCGSGLVDAVTGLVRLGLLDSSGRFVSEEQAAALAPGLAGRLTRIGRERVFVLHWRGAAEDSIYLSQRDVRELQFAKAAIATGWHILLEEAGLTAADVKQVLLAGSFGSYLSPAAAIRIGLVPRVPVQRVVPAGNVAGEGAKMALLSLRERAGGLALLEEVRYVELSDRADFNDRFVEQLPFPPA